MTQHQPESQHQPALQIELLPAAYGDCLLVTAALDDGVYRLLVDTGPDQSALAALRDRLRQIPVLGGKRRIDLFVITHIDHDHIGNAADLLADEELQLEFGDIWFNGYEQVKPFTVRGEAEADEVSAVIKRRSLPLNLAFSGQPVVVPVTADSRWRELGTDPGQPQITLLSPGALQLERLAHEWQQWLTKLKKGEPDGESELDDASQTRGERPPIDLDALASKPFEADSSAPNGSSITLLIEHRGASLLLAADGYAKVYGPALGALLASRGPGRLTVDAVKLAHHGSRRNTESKLALVRAKHYLVSTDNGRYGHPDDETLARLIVHALPGAEPTFWFNYDTELNRRWGLLAQQVPAFSTRYPAGDAPAAGIVLELWGDSA